MIVRFIGDVHGKYQAYLDLIRPVERSIQVGDMGVGFPPGHVTKGTPLKDYDIARFGPLLNAPSPHKFIRGNHDNPQACRENVNWIPDGEVRDEIGFIGGAWSIDWSYRTAGWSWWEDEELSWEELTHCVDTMIEKKPRILVTHDAPISILSHLFPNMLPLQTRTQIALSALFDAYQPELWLFGHWHNRRDVIINGTRFICLEELGYIDLEI